MMRNVILSGIFSIAALPAFALSCVQASVENAFDYAHTAAESYVPVFGAFNGVIPRSEKVTSMPEDRFYTARFTGIALTQRGVDLPMDVDVSVHEDCLASWCPNVPNGMQVLTFLRLEGSTYSFAVNSCSPNAFFSPSQGQVDTLRTCLRNGAC